MTRVALLVAATLFMEFMDKTALTPALPQIAATMHVAALDLSPAISAYALTMSVFILPGGWLTERLGTKHVFVFAIAVFTLSSAFCALAWSPMSLFVARAFQGIGGAMMAPVGRLVVLRTGPKSGLMRAMALLVWPALTAPLLGPIIGGYLTSTLTWRAIFLVNLPLGGISLVTALVLLPNIVSEIPRPFDWVGSFIAGGILVSILMAVDDVAATHGLVSAIFEITCVFALCLLLARHLRRHPDPIVNFHALAYPTFRKTLIGGSCARVLLNAMPFLLPLRFQLDAGYDPLQAGLAITPLFIGNLCMKPLTTPIIRGFGFRRVLIWNGLFQALTMIACTLISRNAAPALIGGLLFISGASRSLCYTSLATLAFADVPQQEMNMANILQSTAQHASFAFGVGVSAALVQIGSTLFGNTHGADFNFAFIVLATLMVLCAIDFARLDKEAGASVSAAKETS